MDILFTIFKLLPILFVIFILLSTFGINQEYERAALFRLGRLKQTKGPGLYWLFPIVDRVVKVDMRTQTIELAAQETLQAQTRKNLVGGAGFEPAFGITRPELQSGAFNHSATRPTRQ